MHERTLIEAKTILRLEDQMPIRRGNENRSRPEIFAVSGKACRQLAVPVQNVRKDAALAATMQDDGNRRVASPRQCIGDCSHTLQTACRSADYNHVEIIHDYTFASSAADGPGAEIAEPSTPPFCLVVEGVLDREALARVRGEVDRIVAEAGKVAANDDVYDLEDTHSWRNPRVRRIKSPHQFFPLFDALTRSPAIIGRIAALIGPDIRLHGTKLNMKAAGYGSAVEWHQDWAFYPHTNDDVLATGLYLDDCDEANGPLMVVPGSHKGAIWDHHADGYFCGAMDPDVCAVDFASARPLTGPAGSMTIHHVRAVHGSALNRSKRMRQLLLHEYAAADAWPLIMRESFEDFVGARMVAGKPTIEPRTVPCPIRMPLPPAPHQGSIYENQKGTRKRFFEVYADAR